MPKIGVVYGVDVLLLFFQNGIQIPEGVAGQSSGSTIRRHCTIFGLMAAFAAIEAEIHADAMLPFLGCEVPSSWESSSASSACPVASSSTSVEDIDFCIGVGLLSKEFLYTRVSTCLSVGLGIHSPVAVKFSSLFN